MEEDGQKTAAGWNKMIEYRALGFEIDETGVLLHYDGTQENVEIPVGIREIEDYAFKGKAVTSVVIPHTVKRIGAFAFYRCEKLTEITVGSGVESIGPFAFLECFALKKVRYHGSIGAWNRITNWKNTIGDYVLDCSGSTTGVFAEEKEEQSGFLTTDTPITTESEKEKEPFSKWLRRKAPWIMWSTAILFLLATAAIMVLFSNYELNFFVYKPVAMILPLGCAVVFGITGFLLLRRGDRDWRHSIRGIAMLVSVIMISLAFLASFSLLFWGKTTTAYDGCTWEYYYDVKEDGTAVIRGRTMILSPKEVEIPSVVDGYRVTEIDGDWKLFDESLQSVTIPSSVITIGNSAFSGCRNLSSVTIPSSVTTIKSYAFSGCRKLSTVTIPSSVTTIGEEAFCHASKLTDIYYQGTMEEWGRISFYTAYAQHRWDYGMPYYIVHCTDGDIEDR